MSYSVTPLSLKQASTSTGSRVVVFLFAAMFLDAVVFPGLGVPANSIAAGLAVIYALLLPAFRSQGPGWIVPLALAIPAWFSLASALNGDPDVRRLLNILLYSVVIIVISSGRLNVQAIGRGLAIAVVLGVLWGAVTLPRSSYEGRLTGPFGDPNAAGFLIAVCTALAIPSLIRMRNRLALLAVAGVGIYLTQSRTSMLAVAIMGLWIVFGRYGAPWLGLTVVGGLMWWINSLPQQALAGGAFASRAGSDALREVIYQAELAEVARNPLIGNGAGTARVELENGTYFYHSSYLALRAEVGWIGFVLLMVLLISALLLLIRLGKHRRNAWFEAALLGAAVCALNLGEVLLTLPTAIAVGLALNYYAAAREEASNPRFAMHKTSLRTRGNRR